MDKKLYSRLRADGLGAKEALRAARIAATWEELEARGLVRMYRSADEDVDLRDYEECDRASIREQIERDGAWGVVTEYLKQGEWEHADSIWGCIGYQDVLDPAENYYVTDLQDEAIEKALLLEAGQEGPQEAQDEAEAAGLASTPQLELKCPVCGAVRAAGVVCKS